MGKSRTGLRSVESSRVKSELTAAWPARSVKIERSKSVDSPRARNEGSRFRGVVSRNQGSGWVCKMGGNSSSSNRRMHEVGGERAVELEECLFSRGFQCPASRYYLERGRPRKKVRVHAQHCTRAQVTKHTPQGPTVVPYMAGRACRGGP